MKKKKYLWLTILPLLLGYSFVFTVLCNLLSEYKDAIILAIGMGLCLGPTLAIVVLVINKFDENGWLK
jgi:hypothetical protein